MFILLILTVVLAVLLEKRVDNMAEYNLVEQQGAVDKAVMLDHGENVSVNNWCIPTIYNIENNAMALNVDTDKEFLIEIVKDNPYPG